MTDSDARVRVLTERTVMVEVATPNEPAGGSHAVLFQQMAETLSGLHDPPVLAVSVETEDDLLRMLAVVSQEMAA